MNKAELKGIPLLDNEQRGYLNIRHSRLPAGVKDELLLPTRQVSINEAGRLVLELVASDQLEAQRCQTRSIIQSQFSRRLDTESPFVWGVDVGAATQRASHQEIIGAITERAMPEGLTFGPTELLIPEVRLQSCR